MHLVHTGHDDIPLVILTARDESSYSASIPPDSPPPSTQIAISTLGVWVYEPDHHAAYRPWRIIQSVVNALSTAEKPIITER